MRNKGCCIWKKHSACPGKKVTVGPFLGTATSSPAEGTAASPQWRAGRRRGPWHIKSSRKETGEDDQKPKEITVVHSDNCDCEQTSLDDTRHQSFSSTDREDVWAGSSREKSAAVILQQKAGRNLQQHNATAQPRGKDIQGTTRQGSCPHR